MLLAQLDPASSVASSPQSTAEPKSEPDSATDEGVSATNKETKPSGSSVMTAFLRGDGARPTARKSTGPKQNSHAVASVVSPEPRATDSTPGSNPKKRNRSKKKAEELKAEEKVEPKASSEPGES